MQSSELDEGVFCRSWKFVKKYRKYMSNVKPRLGNFWEFGIRKDVREERI